MEQENGVQKENYVIDKKRKFFFNMKEGRYDVCVASFLFKIAKMVDIFLHFLPDFFSQMY